MGGSPKIKYLWDQYVCFSKLIYICNYISNLKHPVEAFTVWSFLLMFG